MKRLFLEIPALPKTQPDVYSRKARASIRKRWHKRIAELVMISDWNGAALGQARVTFTRYSSREPDYDGLVYSFKAVLDGLVAARVITDDRPSVIGHPTYLWRKAPHKQGHITIEVVERVELEEDPPS